MGDFNFPYIKWEYHTAWTSKSGKFLRYAEDKTSCQKHLLSQQKKVPDLLFENREGLVGEVAVGFSVCFVLV